MTETIEINKILKPDDSRRHYRDDVFKWGELSVPRKSEINRDDSAGLRVLFIGSCTPGLLVFDSINRFEKKYGGRISIAGIVTDSTVDDRARISMEKRIWRFFNVEQRRQLYEQIREEALSSGISCYSGAVKTDFFHKLLNTWNPELIIMCCYGQMVDAAIFDFPRYGMYNLHPSDLASSIGVGTKPVEHTVSLGNKTSRTTFHIVNEVMDGGTIIGKSPEINITLPDGSYPEDVLSLYNKVCSVCGWMAIDLLMSVAERKSRGGQGRIESLDFEKSMPDDVKNILMEPAGHDSRHNCALPLHTALR